MFQNDFTHINGNLMMGNHMFYILRITNNFFFYIVLSVLRMLLRGKKGRVAICIC